MCHWVLRVWQCGDSFFTKYSSCSFDRAAHDQAGLLNPLHPSITPYGLDNGKHHNGNSRGHSIGMPEGTSAGVPTGPKMGNKTNKRRWKRPNTDRAKQETAQKIGQPDAREARLAVIDLSCPGSTIRTTTHTGSEVVYPLDKRTGKTIPISLAEIGKASRFGDVSLGGEGSKCNVFEVVLQTKESSACPACIRSWRRARLPAHARGCFGLS
ncbi:hypothetical protein B0J11DRAFT_505536 [Dendryphion nanum]|uniref:Uncharacterized protein n=1 Tax=Dendryphion nanum TaxID=256645 RepID=A0A9P9ILJ3_9PLEO|nr:hypothetical protein B0J11DRAFT_505536 [Dendryphion nanum]